MRVLVAGATGVLGLRFRHAVETYAEANAIPWVRFGTASPGGPLRMTCIHTNDRMITEWVEPG